MAHYSLRSLTLILPAALCLGAATAAAPSFAADKPTIDDNPLLTESRLPFGYPRFDAIKDEHFAPTFEQGMAEHRKDTAAIATDPLEPSFENTVIVYHEDVVH